MASLADYADNPEVVAYLKALQAATGPNLGAQGTSPFDSWLTAAQNQARTHYQNTIAGLAAQEPIIRRRFGFTEAGEIDPSNPFGRAQLMKRSYDQQQRGTSNALAARGQLYSGALQRQKNENQFRYQANDQALRGEYGQQMAGLSAARFAAQNQLSQALNNAYFGWLDRVLAARAAEPYSSAPAGGDDTAGGGGWAGSPSDFGAPTALGPVGSVHAGGAVGPQYDNPLAALAPFANDPAVVAYLKAEYAKQQQAQQPQLVGLPLLKPKPVKQGKPGTGHGGAVYGG